MWLNWPISWSPVQLTLTSLRSLPGAIDYANLRIQREMDLLATSTINSTATFTVNSKILTLPVPPQGEFVVVTEIAAISPSTATTDTGTRNVLQFVSKQFIDMVYPNTTQNSTIPQYAYMLSDTQAWVGPAPDLAYPVEVTGTIRMAPPSVSNSSTYLLTYFPDLFLSASMIFASGYQRDFGSQSDNPAQSGSWEAMYQGQLKSAMEEEARKKSESQGWTTETSNNATPARV